MCSFPPPNTGCFNLTDILMNERRVGIWLIGAAGGVGTTAVLGLAAQRQGLCDATSMVTALPLFDGLDLDGYLYFHSTRGELLRRLGRDDEARTAYRRALELATSTPERRFLSRRRVFWSGRLACWVSRRCPCDG